MNHLSQDTLFDIASFLTVSEYCNSFILVCSAFYETTTYEIVWSHFYEQHLVADIKKFTEEKDNRLGRVRGLHKKHIQQNTTAKDRLLRGNGYLNALSQYCYASRLRECNNFIIKAFKKPVNKPKRDIEDYSQFIEPYERVFSEMDKLFAFVGPSQDEENIKRRYTIMKVLYNGETYNGKSFLQWFIIDMETALANTSISRSDIVKYTQETLVKLVHTYKVRIMGEIEFKKTDHDHIALVAAIKTGIQPLIDTIIQLYQHEQQTYKLYGGKSLLGTIIQCCQNNFQYYMDSPILFPTGHIESILKGVSAYFVYNVISRFATIPCMQYMFDHFGFQPSLFDPYQRDIIAGSNQYDKIKWCFDHGMHCHNDTSQPFLHRVIKNAPSDRAQADETLRIIKLVLDHPECDISAVDANNHDVFVAASFYNVDYSREIIQMLIEHGGDPHRVIDSRTALSFVLNLCSFEKFMEIQDLLANETTIRHFNGNMNGVRQVLERFPAITDAVAILKIWMDKFNIDINELDPSGAGTKEYFQNNYSQEMLERIQEVFDALNVELK